MKPRHLSLLTAAAAVLALAVGLATASAGGGNSASAKLCQKNGWQTLVTSNGATFTNEDECTAYGARGGVFYPESAAPCLNGGWQTPAQRSDGTAFSSQTDCVAYTGNGGVVYKPSLIATPSTVRENENIAFSVSGFHPNSTGQVTIVTLPLNVSSTLVAVTDGNGGFTGGSSVFTTGACALGETGEQLTWVDGFGVHASATVALDCS